MRELLSGNEAVARGAWEGGVRVASAYPGTPSTEILESLARYEGVAAEWAPNEKVALDVAIGAAYAGVRAMAVMKHVGLNVAADSFFYAAMTGVEAGLLVVVADDPGMHSSQNEQDSRRYARFARVPCLEPSDSQEAKDLVGLALAISEEFGGPVLLRTSTRIAHSSAVVELGPPPAPAGPVPPYRVDPAKYVMVPANARPRHPIMEERIARLAAWAETFPANRLEWRDRRLGIVTAGVAYQYAREVLPEASILRLGMTYPVPAQLLRQFAAGVERLIVLEELDPFLEEELRLLGIAAEGSGIFPRCGELDPTVVRESAIRAGLLPESERRPTVRPEAPPLPPRPPILCPGCPHRGVFHVLRKLKLVVNGDIGCYTLGYLPPLGALHTCGCMGASIGVAHGVAQARPEGSRNVAVIGDSTFLHSGMPALLNLAYNQGHSVVVILDNQTTAMTGHQDHPATGRTLRGQETVRVDLPTLARALGIEHVYVADSYDLKAVEEAMRAGLAAEAPAVVIAQRACVLLPSVRPTWRALAVDAERCNGCGLCLQLGCPALSRTDQITAAARAIVRIDPLLCTGCRVCAQVCVRKAISDP